MVTGETDPTPTCKHCRHILTVEHILGIFAPNMNMIQNNTSNTSQLSRIVLHSHFLIM